MKMKMHTIKLLLTAIGIPLLAGMHSNSFADEVAKKTTPVKKPAATVSASNKSCIDEKAEFKKLYIQLQNSLNYEGKDAYLVNGKGAVQLKPHVGSTYEGKVFEEALFKEYQNTLRKVALMYQSAKFDTTNAPEFKSNKALVDFIKAVDDTKASEQYIASNNVMKVIEELQKASAAKYPAGSKSIITNNDKYMLQKLLSHSQDRLCSIEKYEKTGKRDRNFTAKELEEKKNAPLNQLILAIKDAKLTKDSDLKFEDIPDEKTAINSAIAANMKALNDWAKKNKNCIDAVKNVGFMNSIQAGIQACNYNKFVDTLDNANVTNIEQVLHFINSNEQFLKGVQAKAETSLDELKLQAFVDRTFENLGNKINCTEITNPTNSRKRLFLRNLPYKDAENKFDTSKIACKIVTPASKKSQASEKILSEKECAAKIVLVSDELGRGIEVRQKNPNEAAITFSIKDNPDCSDIALATAAEVPPTKPEVKPEVTPSEPAVVTPPQVAAAVIWTAQMCIDEAVKIKFPGVGTLVEGKCVNVATDEACDKQKKGQIANPAKTECIDPPATTTTTAPEAETEVTCKVKGMALDSTKTPAACKPKDDPEALKCKENNDKLSEENGGRPMSDWELKDGKCINKKYKAKKLQDTVFDDEDEKALPDNSKFNIPARFTPIQIPTRQMYILPGMP